MTTSQIFSVPDISCEHCVNAITAEVSILPGVESVDVALDAKTVSVAGGETAAIVAAIDEAGFDAEPVVTARSAATTEQQIDDGVIRVTKWTFPPGSETGHHQHEYDYVVVPITGGELTIESSEGTLKAPLVIGGSYNRAKGVMHNVANDGDAEVAFVEIELLDR